MKIDGDVVERTKRPRLGWKQVIKKTTDNKDDNLIDENNNTRVKDSEVINHLEL